jgi:hypothetical protein
MTALPGNRGALPALTPEEAALAASLKRHIATIAAREHNVAHMTSSRRSPTTSRPHSRR